MASAAPAADQADAGFSWQLPPGMPLPRVPADNPMSELKVELGRRLFYDTRLSSTGAYACASCHQQARAFTDGRARAVGATGELHPRGAMSLANVAYHTRFGWADPETASLEEQAAIPMFNQAPIELGLRGREAAVAAQLRGDPVYSSGLPRAFPEAQDPFDLAHVARAIAAFERTLISGDSPYDRYVYRDERDALTPEARRGLGLFTSERLACSRCHGGPSFAGLGAEYHDTGLYSLDAAGMRRLGAEGVFAHTRELADLGRFRAPGLRNIALTAPYMHDGSIPTLAEVLQHYARGGRHWTSAAGEPGPRSPHQSPLVSGFALGPGDAEALLAFLGSLTDEGFVTDPRFGDPGREGGR